MMRTITRLREDSLIEFVWGKVSGTLKGVGVLYLLDVPVKMEIIHGSHSFHMPFSGTFQSQN